MKLVVLERVGVRGGGPNGRGPASDADCAADSFLGHSGVSETGGELDIWKPRTLGVRGGRACREAYSCEEDESRRKRGRAL